MNGEKYGEFEVSVKEDGKEVMADYVVRTIRLKKASDINHKTFFFRHAPDQSKTALSSLPLLSRAAKNGRLNIFSFSSGRCTGYRISVCALPFYTSLHTLCLRPLRLLSLSL